MQNDLNKKKAEFLKNIMSHPKLSRVFSDALSSPIGSTKREQSKSILSIMKKLRGIKNDGQGGPGMPYVSSPSTNPVSANTKNDYSNLIIFPAAPKFKTRTETKKQDGQGGPTDFSSVSIGFDKDFIKNIKNPPRLPKSPFASEQNASLPESSYFSQKPNFGFSGFTNIKDFPNLSNLSINANPQVQTQDKSLTGFNAPAPKLGEGYVTEKMNYPFSQKETLIEDQ